MNKYASKERAKEILEAQKGETAYFSGELSINRMYEMLREMRFGVAEQNVIIAALVVAGAKFKETKR